MNDLEIRDNRSTGPKIDVVIGTVFSFGERPILEIGPVDRPVTLRDGWVVIRHRPRHWWHLVSWIRICRLLWAMPTASQWPERQIPAVELRDGWIVPS